MECHEIRAQVETAAFQSLSELEVDEIAAHIENGCPECAAQHLDALRLRQRTDRIRSGSGFEEARTRLRRRIGLMRGLAFLVVVGVVWVTISQAVRVAHYAYEKKFVERLEKAIFRYRLDHGHYPPAGLPLGESLRDSPGEPYLDLRSERLDGRGDFVDRWGNPYRYRLPGEHNAGLFDIWSAGRDRQDEGGRGDDVVNWNEYRFVPGG